MGTEFSTRGEDGKCMPGYLSRYGDRLRPGFDSRQGLDFSLLHNVQTGSGAHPAFYSAGTGAFSPGIKRSGREADRDKNGTSVPPFLSTSSWLGA
jgi:hypothetical protein